VKIIKRLLIDTVWQSLPVFKTGKTILFKTHIYQIAGDLVYSAVDNYAIDTLHNFVSEEAFELTCKLNSSRLDWEYFHMSRELEICV
jgi:hypothetical protein